MSRAWGWTRARSVLRRRRVGLAVLMLAAYLLCYGSWQLVHWGPESQQRLLSNVFFLPVDAAAVVLAWRASRRASALPRLRRAWLLLGGAFLALTLGDGLYGVYELRGIAPYPSAADAVYLAFYPLMLMGALSIPSVTLPRAARLRVWVDLAITSLGGSAVFVYLILGPTALADNGNALQSLVTIAYPVGDLVALTGLSLLLLRGVTPSARRPLNLVALGLGCFVAADLVYGYQTLHAGYTDGSWVDALWFTAVVLFALAGAGQERVAAGEQSAAPAARVARLPFVALAGGFGLLLYAERDAAFFPGLVMTLIALALALLVSLRQFLAQADLLGAQRQLRHQALHDGLTGLPNRELLHDRLRQALVRRERGGGRVAVMLLDVDDFKETNDVLGHAAGDRLLIEVAARLRRACRGAETVARLGGDEFALVADGRLDEPALVSLAERVLSCFAEPFVVGAELRRCSGSLGIALAEEGAPTPDDVLRNADVAMYRAKRQGKGGYELFDDELRAELHRHIEVGAALERAVAAGEVRVHYQPIVSADGRMLAVEALARWTDGSLGQVTPDEFIPLAEQKGLIVPLGRNVLRQALAQLAAWRAADPDALPLGMFVNVSQPELAEPDLPDAVSAVLADSGLDPADLTLELTERTYGEACSEGVRRTLDELNARGVRLALDDVGSSYTALGSLTRFPFSALKIDRCFIEQIREPDAEAPVTRAIVALAHSLDLLVVAEGVETELQRTRLRDLGCDALQGFLLGRPGPADALAAGSKSLAA